ncbi:hypothetical protein BC830DRAFT_1082947 [Chytriomyces sp. MP71]|nr:hypothetical protein BC830DRAFT_1082947 [Chytriomyces sp. MP71]
MLPILLASLAAMAGSSVLFAPYVDTTAGNFDPVAYNAQTGAKTFALGFVAANANDQPQFNGNLVSNSWYQSQVKAIRALGGDVVVQQAMSWEQSPPARRFWPTTDSANYLDFDIEQQPGIASTMAGDMRNQTIKIVQGQSPIVKVAYTLPSAAFGLVDTGLMSLTRPPNLDLMEKYSITAVEVAYKQSAPRSGAEYWNHTHYWCQRRSSVNIMDVQQVAAYAVMAPLGIVCVYVLVHLGSSVASISTRGHRYRLLSRQSHVQSLGEAGHPQLRDSWALLHCLFGCRKKIGGAEFAQECYCFNTLPSQQLASNQCNMPCSGDASQTCGAGWIMTVAPDKPWSPSQGYRCRLLPRQVHFRASTKQISLSAVTPSTCAEFSNECYCFKTLPSQQLASSNCDMACSGDASQTCGGGWTLTVASNGAQLTIFGCFQDNATFRASTKQASLDSVIPMTCLSACVAAGCTFGGAEYSSSAIASTHCRPSSLRATSVAWLAPATRAKSVEVVGRPSCPTDLPLFPSPKLLAASKIVPLSDAQ